MANLKLLKYGKFHKEDSDKISHWKAEQYDTVLSPYDGEILKTEENKPCGNYILIKHILKNGIFYSEICGINSDLITGSGYKVRKGEALAKSNDNDVIVKYLDHNKKKMSLSDLNSLLTTSEKESSKKEEKAKKETEEKSKKETEEKSKKEKENNKIGGEKESFWDKVRNFEKPEDSPNLFSSLMLTPFSFFGKALTSPNKQKIKEDIDRIKQLMK